MASTFEDDDLGSQFESVFNDDSDDDGFERGGARLTRKKSGVQFKEKPGLKKKPSMRELKKRTATRKGLGGMGDWKKELKKMNQELTGKPMTKEEKLKAEEKQKKIRVVSAKIHMNNENRFEGKWESEDVSMDTFLDELSVGAAFRKLAAKFGGTTVQKLYIKQDGEYFEIVESNDRRDVYMALTINENFDSASERGEKLECIANWDDPKKREELIIEFFNVETKEKSLVRRSVSQDRTQLFETKEDGNGNVIKKRTYERRLTAKDLI